MSNRVRWQASEEREKDGLGLLFLVRTSRQEIIVRVEVKNSDPMLWGEWGFPKMFGFRGSIDQCYLELSTKELKP